MEQDILLNGNIVLTKNAPDMGRLVFLVEYESYVYALIMAHTDEGLEHEECLEFTSYSNAVRGIEDYR